MTNKWIKDDKWITVNTKGQKLTNRQKTQMGENNR